MGLEVKSVREMHKLLACGFEENPPDDSMVRSEKGLGQRFTTLGHTTYLVDIYLCN